MTGFVLRLWARLLDALFAAAKRGNKLALLILYWGATTPRRTK